MPKIHIRDDVYDKLKGLAERENRSISNMAETILLNVWGKQPADGSFITSELKTPPTPKNTEVKNPADVSDLLHDKVMPEPLYPEKNNSVASDLVKNLPDNMQVELPCCANEFKPCKHWVWDVTSGEGYRNILSGRFLEVE